MKSNTCKYARNFYLKSFRDDNTIDFLTAAALFINVVDSSEGDVVLHFSGGYISPGFAVPLMSARDSKNKKGYNLYFQAKELDSTPEMRTFFLSSGIHNTLNEQSQNTVKRMLHTNQKKESGDMSVPAHAILLSDIAENDDGNRVLLNEAIKLLMMIFTDSSTKDRSSLYVPLVVSVLELFENARDHGLGNKIYSIAQDARDGDHLVIIYDDGMGIPGAYRAYQATLKNKMQSNKTDVEIMEWALRKGTSTKQAIRGIPRGLGLPGIREFADNYSAEFGIASGNGIYYYEGSKPQIIKIENGLPGTMFVLKVHSWR